MAADKIEKPTALTVGNQNDKPIVAEESQIVNDYDIDAFLEKRKEFITKVNSIMVEKSDYHVIQGKKSLAKGGAEKIASIFGWQSEFRKDADSLEMLGNVAGLVSYICTLTKNTKFVGEGRGAASLAKNAGDPNKKLKMAQKSAFIDAVLRASGLSDFFTQDLEDMPANTVSTPAQNSTTAKLSTEFYCSEHDQTIGFIPAGVSKKTGKPYKAFYICSQKGCRAPILNSEGVRVRQNPETGEMQPDEIPTIQVEESSADKARRILNDKIPPNHGKELEFNT